MVDFELVGSLLAVDDAGVGGTMGSQSLRVMVPAAAMRMKSRVERTVSRDSL